MFQYLSDGSQRTPTSGVPKAPGAPSAFHQMGCIFQYSSTLCNQICGNEDMGRPSSESRKLLFPISLQLKGTRLPQENWCCFRLTIIIWLGVIYVYTCIDCQSSILSHMVPELINNLICWNCKGCIGKSIGPVQYRFTIPSLLAQCHVAGSMPRCWLSAS